MFRLRRTTHLIVVAGLGPAATSRGVPLAGNRGWRWSLHVGPAIGGSSCSVEHVGIVVSGRATAAMDDGTITELRSGDVFHIAPGHDSWVVGDEPYVSLHFLGADRYADRS